MHDDDVRVAKLIAARGLMSRRKAEEAVAGRRVSLDGKIIDDPATHVPPGADLRVDGKPLPPEPHKVYYLLYKPRGYITGRNDPHGRKSVLELVEDLRVRVEPVGRLDYDTEGALLLTNDGALAHKLTHPSTGVPRRYRAKVYRTPDARKLRKIEQGNVFLDDGKVGPAKVRVLDATDKDNAWVEITVTEGRNRLIRRLFAQLGHPVAKLRRETFATLSIRNMERGDVRELTPEEVGRLRDLARGVKPTKAGKTAYKKGFARPKAKPARGGRRRKDRA